MLDPTLPAPAVTRLRALLEDSASGLGDESVAMARSIGPEAATAAVTSLLEAELTHPAASRAAIRAAHLARELRLVGAIPHLVRCVEHLPGIHPLREAALAAVTRLGHPAVDALLASFDRCRTTEARARVAEALSRVAVDDDRIRVALVRMLEDDPSTAARHLASRGEWAAVPGLAEAVERLAVAPVAECALCAAQDLSTIAYTIHVLGGALSPAQERTLDGGLARWDPLWMPPDDAFSRAGADPGPAARPRLPGRNDPCPCGSGKKFKRCCLQTDERDARH